MKKESKTHYEKSPLNIHSESLMKAVEETIEHEGSILASIYKEIAKRVEKRKNN